MRLLPLAVVLALSAGLAAPAASPAAARCKTKTVKVQAPAKVTIALGCVAGKKTIARGKQRGLTRKITRRPSKGTLSRIDARRGSVVYRPRAGASGADSFRFSVRRAGRTFLATVKLRITPQKTTDTTPPVDSNPVDNTPSDPLADVPASVAFTRNWNPAAADTCPKSLHESFSVVGPDGLKYPTWHPPTVLNPATGSVCTFGHEHGRDPRGSDIYDWVAAHFADPSHPTAAGIPFGLATEALETWSQNNPGVVKRSEDNPGYKIDFVNDRRLLAGDGSDLGVTCDTLVRVHQGSHSPDATANNVHELLYAARCSDGTEVISNTIARFGNPGEYKRGCDPAVTISTTDNGYPAGEGVRQIPDRACVLQNFLVPGGRTTSAWALYEWWSARVSLVTAGGRNLATMGSAFGVFNPARYADPAGTSGVGRSIGLCWEREENGDRANTALCDSATANNTIAQPFAYTDTRSPFNGTYRDTYLEDVRVDNEGTTELWWTDPYGENASPRPFPGGVCQLISPVKTQRAAARQDVYGRNRTNNAPGVHAPN